MLGAGLGRALGQDAGGQLAVGGPHLHLDAVRGHGQRRGRARLQVLQPDPFEILTTLIARLALAAPRSRPARAFAR